MAVRIRLTRKGRKKQPHYRIVVADSQASRDGKFLDIVGTYDPMQNPAIVTIDDEKLDAWMQKGATLTVTVQSLLKKHRTGTAAAA